MSVVVNDAHVHFFSPSFFAGLGADRDTITRLGWEFPESGDALGARWVAELAKHGLTAEQNLDYGFFVRDPEGIPVQIVGT